MTSVIALTRAQTMNELVNQEPEDIVGKETIEPKVEAAKDVVHGIEKFTASDLAALRNDLLQSGVDSFQAADLVATFLSGRGYGISTDEARGVASKIEGVGCTVESIQEELERVAHFA
jgi:hypothetical protein